MKGGTSKYQKYIIKGVYNMSKEQKQNVEVECDYELSEYQKRGMMPCDYSG